MVACWLAGSLVVEEVGALVLDPTDIHEWRNVSHMLRDSLRRQSIFNLNLLGVHLGSCLWQSYSLGRHRHL